MKINDIKTSLGSLVAAISLLLPRLGINVTPEEQMAMVTIAVMVIGFFAGDSSKATVEKNTKK